MLFIMILEDIIEGLNEYIKENRGLKTNVEHLVLQRSILPHTSIKAYKKYQYILWLVKGNINIEVVKVVRTFRVTNEEERNKAEKLITVEFSKSLFEWVKSKRYYNIIPN